MFETIIKYVLDMLSENKLTELRYTLEIVLKLLNGLNYSMDKEKILNIIFYGGDEDAE